MPRKKQVEEIEVLIVLSHSSDVAYSTGNFSGYRDFHGCVLKFEGRPPSKATPSK